MPIVFPESITGLANISDLNKKTNEHKIFKDLFILPTFNELDEISVGPNGKSKRLNKAQLESIKRDGQFDVESSYFPGKKHRWVLTKLLQDGYVNSNEAFFKVKKNKSQILTKYLNKNKN